MKQFLCEGNLRYTKGRDCMSLHMGAFDERWFKNAMTSEWDIQEFKAYLGFELNFSMSLQPQTNGQMEIVNMLLELYLQCYVSYI